MSLSLRSSALVSAQAPIDLAIVLSGSGSLTSSLQTGVSLAINLLGTGSLVGDLQTSILMSGLFLGSGSLLGDVVLGTSSVSVTHDLTLVSNADSAINWHPGNDTAAASVDPDVKIQGGGAISCKVTGVVTNSGLMYDFVTPTDLSNTHLIAWFFTMQSFDIQAAGGVRIRVSSDLDGLNNFGEWFVRGSDTNIGPRSSFHPLAVDTSRPFDNVSNPPALSAVQSVGVVCNFTSSNGRISFFVDVIRRGNGGLTVKGGSDLVPGNSEDIVLEDERAVNGYGLFVRVGGSFLLQGLLRFGATSPSDSYFRDVNQVWVFSGQPVSQTFHRLEFVGSSFNINEFTLGTKVGTGLAADGVSGITFLVEGAAPLRFISTDPNMLVRLYGCSFLNSTSVGGFIKLEQPNLESLSCLFASCDAITVRNNAVLRGATITGSVSPSTSAALDFGAVNPNAVADKVRDITIIGGVNGILLKGSGNTSYTFPNISFSDQTGKKVRVDFGANDTVTIDILSGGDPILQADLDIVNVGTTVVINNNTVIKLNKLKDNTEVRVFNQSGVELAGIENAVDGVAGNRSFTFSAASGLVINYRIINITHLFSDVTGFVVPSSDLVIDIVQVFDRNYLNQV